METFFHIFIKLLVGFVSLFVATKLIGGREVKQLTVFDFISAIVLSELVGNVLYADDSNAFHMIFAIVTWAILIISIDKITLKFKKSRPLLDGEPHLIIEQGIIDKSILKKHRIDLTELLSLLRQKDIFSIKEVAYAFIEPNGSISVLKQPQPESSQTGTPSLPVPLIMDGELSKQALKKINKEEQWLLKRLHAQGYERVEQIFYGEYNEGEKLHLQEQTEGV